MLVDFYARTQAAVHVRTGGLRASGRLESSHHGDSWQGGIFYARDPGVFELARGGSHYFFRPADDGMSRRVGEIVLGFMEG
jgi:hypothetical protein